MASYEERKAARRFQRMNPPQQSGGGGGDNTDKKVMTVIGVVALAYFTGGASTAAEGAAAESAAGEMVAAESYGATASGAAGADLAAADLVAAEGGGSMANAAMMEDAAGNVTASSAQNLLADQGAQTTVPVVQSSAPPMTDAGNTNLSAPPAQEVSAPVQQLDRGAPTNNPNAALDAGADSDLGGFNRNELGGSTKVVDKPFFDAAEKKGLLAGSLSGVGQFIGQTNMAEINKEAALEVQRAKEDAAVRAAQEKTRRSAAGVQGVSLGMKPKEGTVLRRPDGSLVFVPGTGLLASRMGG